MELFELKDFSLSFAPQTLAIDVFKAIIDRDKTKDKSIAIKEMSFIYFFADDRSDFKSFIDDNERTEEIKLALSIDHKWKPDKQILEAIDFYIKMEETVGSRLLNSCLIAADKMGKFLEGIDLNKEDEKGKLVHNVKQVNDTIKQVPLTIKSLLEAQREIKKEKEAKSGARGSIQKGDFEDIE